jgi:hypothetical protein
MIVKVNLKGGFKLVQEGNRTLEITEAKLTPSGAPERLVLSMKDIEDGASLQNSFNMKNETSLWAMGMLLNVALGLNDGDEFNTNDVDKLVGIKLVCEVAHSEYNGRTYANVKKVISKVDDTTGEVDFKAIDETLYGRSELTDDLD